MSNLIERLRNPNPLSLAGPGIIGVMREAADALESQAREIDELKATNATRLQLLNDALVNNDELRAALKMHLSRRGKSQLPEAVALYKEIRELKEVYNELVDIRMRLIRGAVEYWNSAELQGKYSIEDYLEELANK